MMCICGEVLEGHVCKLSHKERMIRYSDYCVKNNIKNICCVSSVTTVTPFSHKLRGCVNCDEKLPLAPHLYTSVYSKSIKNNGLLAFACDVCYFKLDFQKCIINNEVCCRIYCFVNMEIPSICRKTKLLRQLLVREVYKQHKVPRDIRILKNSLLSCAC